MIFHPPPKKKKHTCRKNHHTKRPNIKQQLPSICNICLENLKFQLHLSKEVWWRFIDQVGQCFIQTFHQTIQMTFSASFETGNLLCKAQHLQQVSPMKITPIPGYTRGRYWFIVDNTNESICNLDSFRDFQEGSKTKWQNL